MQALYADSYTLSGCGDNNIGYQSEPCGVFTRVEAYCAAGSGARCPGGALAAGNADPTLCDGAPVYQNAHGYVLLRLSEGGGTRWYVTHEHLYDCDFGDDCPDCDYRSDLNPGRPGYAPTAPAYGQWSAPRFPESISVVVGGGR